MVKSKEVARKVIQFIKRYWIFVILAAMVGILLVIRLSQRGQPSPPAPQPSPAPQIKLSPPKITGVNLPRNSTVSISDFSFPPRLKIYQGSESKISSDQAIKIAQEFGFSGSPRKSEDLFLGNFYTWATKNKFLSIALDSNMINYGLDLSQSQPPTQGTLPSPKTTKTALENLLKKVGLTPQYETKWQKEVYLANRYSLPPVATPEEADFIKIGANPAIGQYQLVGLDPTEPLISLILNKNKEIIRFQYQVYFSSFEGQETYDLRTKEEIKTMLLSEGRIVYFGTFQKSARPPEITQAEFSQITLAYYQNPEKSPVIQPIYILSGKGVLESGEETEIIAYMPAIRLGTPLPEKQFFELPELP